MYFEAKTIIVDFLDVQCDNGKSNNIMLINSGKWNWYWGDMGFIPVSNEWWGNDSKQYDHCETWCK